MNELKYISNKRFASGRSRENFLLNRFFFLILLRTDNDLVVSEMKSKLGGHRLRFRDKACGKLVF